MATNYPGALDTGTTLPNPTTGSATNNPSHAGLHGNENAAIIATQTKLGTGATAPASNTLLVGTGAGTSAWQALTSSQLAGILSDETGSGSLVFANTPTLITPKVDTINESTPSNGVNVGGVLLKSGAVTASGLITGSAGFTLSSGTLTLPNNSIAGTMLSTSAIKLGYAEITTSGTVASATRQTLSNPLSVTVTVPAGGRDIEITFFCGGAATNGGVGQTSTIAIMESTTCLGQVVWDEPVNSYRMPICFAARVSAPSSGSHTYLIHGATTGGTLTVNAGTANPTVTNYGPAFILVKAI